MMDLVEKNGDKIDVKKLQEELGLPVVEISALISFKVSCINDINNTIRFFIKNIITRNYFFWCIR